VEIKHTPTPAFKLEPLRIGSDLDHPIINEVATRIAVPVYEEGRADDRLAIAAHIVKCVNAHDDLVREMQTAVSIVERYQNDPAELKRRMIAWLGPDRIQPGVGACGALAKAEGK
jgi:hypothetical protein